jgi:hypothetical protein
VIQAQAHGGLRPNIVMTSLPPPNQPRRRRAAAAVMTSALGLGCNLVVYKGARKSSGRRRLDLWWSGERNGSLMALFAYLIANHPSWRGVEVRMLRLVSEPSAQREGRANLEELMEAARIPATVEVVLSSRPFAEVVVETSGDADLVLLGLAERDAERPEALWEKDALLAQLPATLLVCSNGELDLLA